MAAGKHQEIHTLILEDDLETLETIYSVLKTLENEVLWREFITTQYSTYEQVEQFVNQQSADQFDLILLDRDCKAAGSFHTLEIEKFGPENIVSISSVPEWNHQARERGIQRVVMKDLLNLHVFEVELNQELNDYLEVNLPKT